VAVRRANARWWVHPISFSPPFSSFFLHFSFFFVFLFYFIFIWFTDTAKVRVIKDVVLSATGWATHPAGAPRRWRGSRATRSAPAATARAARRIARTAAFFIATNTNKNKFRTTAVLLCVREPALHFSNTPSKTPAVMRAALLLVVALAAFVNAGERKERAKRRAHGRNQFR
jgi:hypothetical protein